ncbi:hypothetical protein ACFLZM_07660 [Thermodesulfobacteriota bacterium]
MHGVIRSGIIFTLLISLIHAISARGDEFYFIDAHSQVDHKVVPLQKVISIMKQGGAAKAVVFILNWLRTGSIIVTGRNHEKSTEIVNRFSGEARPIEALLSEPIPAEILINATSVSSADEAPELAQLIGKLETPGCELVLDLNYGRKQNFWKDMADSRGVRFMDGLSALAFQARRTFALWTGVQVPPAEFLNALNDTS